MADFYVNSSGADTNDGSIGSPWKTVNPVNSRAFQAGETVNFAGGQFFAGKVTFSAADVGTAANPVIMQSYGTGRATINGGVLGGLVISNTAGLVITNINFVGNGSLANNEDGILISSSLGTALTGITIDHVDVSGFGLRGIAVRNLSAVLNDLTITDCTVHDNRIDGIFSSVVFGRIDGLIVRNCTVYNNSGLNGTASDGITYGPGGTVASGSGIQFGGVINALIENCVAYNNGTIGAGGVGIWYVSADTVTIQFCESHHNQDPAVHWDGNGFNFDGVTNGLMQYNYSHDNVGCGYLLDDYAGEPNGYGPNIMRYNLSINDCTYNLAGIYIAPENTTTSHGATEIYGNTIVGTKEAVGFQSFGGAGPTDFHFRNNIFVRTTPGALLTMPSTLTPGLIFNGNDWWNTGGSFTMQWHNAALTTYALWKTASSQEANGYSVDPLFASGTGTDAYKLQTGSPLINTGINLATIPLTTGPRDFFGNAVPTGGFDIGAHEYPPSVVYANESGNSNEVGVTASATFVLSPPPTVGGPAGELGPIHAHGRRHSGHSAELGPIQAEATLLDKPPLVDAPIVVCGPAAPTVLSTITDGMIEAGQYHVTVTQVNSFYNAQFQTLKSEMWFKCQTDELLETEVVLIAQTGISAIQLPCDFDTEVSVFRYDGIRGIALSGTGEVDTLGLSTVGLDESQLLGRPLFLTSWNGAPQMRQIVAYDATRAVATVDGPWDWMPTVGTTYLLGTSAAQLTRTDHRRTPQASGLPMTYTRSGLTFTVVPAGDQIYPLLMLYRANLTQINEDSAVFAKHLRQRRALWMQGIKAKTMARFDDERAPQEEQKWQFLLNQYAASNAVYEQTDGSR